MELWCAPFLLCFMSSMYSPFSRGFLRGGGGELAPVKKLSEGTRISIMRTCGAAAIPCFAVKLGEVDPVCKKAALPQP